MIGNAFLLLGFAIGVAGLAALGIIVGLKWILQNPTLLIGIAIGAAIAVFATVKIRNSQDAGLVERYHRSQEREPIARPTKQPKTKPAMAQSKISIDDLCEGLHKYGYQKTEAREAIESVLEDMPDASETDVVTAAIHYLSDDKIGV